MKNSWTELKSSDLKAIDGGGYIYDLYRIYVAEEGDFASGFARGFTRGFF